MQRGATNDPRILLSPSHLLLLLLSIPRHSSTLSLFINSLPCQNSNPRHPPSPCMSAFVSPMFYINACRLSGLNRITFNACCPTLLPSLSLPFSFLCLFSYGLNFWLIKKIKRKLLTMKAGTRPPWVGLGAAVWLQIASTFPLYSHSLKSVLGFNQHQLTMLGVANDIGENMGLLPGLVCNKFPPWVILTIGAFAFFFGYGVLWLALSGTLPSLPYSLVTSSSTFLGLKKKLLILI